MLIPTPIRESMGPLPPSAADGFGALAEAVAAGWEVSVDAAEGAAIATVELSDCAKDGAGHRFIRQNRSSGAAIFDIRNLTLLSWFGRPKSALLSSLDFLAGGGVQFRHCLSG